MASSISNENNREPGLSAADNDADGISFGLQALGELHAQQHAASPRPPAAPGLTPEAGAGEGPNASPEPAADGDEAKANLQAALDWYKDWLSSI